MTADRPYVERDLPAGWDLLELHRRDPHNYPHLLQSTATGGPQARFDILFAFPQHRIEGPPERFLACLDAEYGATLGAAGEGPPFRGGWFLYLGYELAHAIEPRLGAAPRHPWGWETAWAEYFPSAIIHDHARQRRYAVAVGSQPQLLDRLVSDAQSVADSGGAGDEASVVAIEALFPPKKAPYLHAVEHILRYIRAGDIYQANLSQAWQGRLASMVTPADLYAALRHANPAPFAGLARWGGRAVVSSSPERLVQVDGRWASLRPIAGTHPRAASEAEDRALRARLLAHPKERAEHIMLLDLERNDLGRVAETGTVEVDEAMICETYRHVHHIVSNVRGRLREEITPGRLIRAVFPGGTITGCPKVRCMEILASLEGQARGAYTGSMGYLSLHGRLDLNILIRSFEVDGERFRFRAGAGIVADSRPLAEFDECCHKAEGLLRALRWR